MAPRRRRAYRVRRGGGGAGRRGDCARVILVIPAAARCSVRSLRKCVKLVRYGAPGRASRGRGRRAGNATHEYGPPPRPATPHRVTSHATACHFRGRHDVPIQLASPRRSRSHTAPPPGHAQPTWCSRPSPCRRPLRILHSTAEVLAGCIPARRPGTPAHPHTHSHTHAHTDKANWIGRIHQRGPRHAIASPLCRKEGENPRGPSRQDPDRSVLGTPGRENTRCGPRLSHTWWCGPRLFYVGNNMRNNVHLFVPRWSRKMIACS